MSAIQQAEPRELTDEEQEQRAAVCFTLEKDIKDSIAQGRDVLWGLAARLYDFDEANGWSALGYETQGQWLAQPDIGLSRDQYFRLVGLHRELVVYRSVPDDKLLELDHSKVSIVLPAIKKHEGSIDNILDDVKELPASDLRRKYIGKEEIHTPPVVSEGEDGEVIEGHETNGATLTKEEKEAVKRAESLQTAILAVDSWLSVGGDRRKAKRHWERFLELQPQFEVIRQITECVEGGDDAPKREDVAPEWRGLAKTLKLKLEA